MPQKMILTAGPSITRREIGYVLDAVQNGWNENWDSYIRRFEVAFAKFLGVKYALATSSCTGAMHLALLALGIKKGDEVIIPDQAWVAPASAVRYVGAKPVFADVEKDTWCLDPASVEKMITRRTRAILPVHLYGHPCEMNRLNRIARAHKLFMIEDAAQSIGSLYRGKRPGALGDIGCFSFQGAKIMVTGEGGMLTTNSKKMYEQAKFYNNHGRDPKGSFYIHEVGYKYKISNLQAALGLAQLERIHELVAKKRRVFHWYRKRLAGIDGIMLNTEQPGIKTNYWMTSIVLTKKFRVGRDELMKILKEKYRVDTRTFYYPIGAFKPFKQKQKNPVSTFLAFNGINLPSGYHLTEDDVDRVARGIRETLGI